MKKTLQKVRQSLPASWYYDPDHYQFELEKIIVKVRRVFDKLIIKGATCWSRRHGQPKRLKGT